MNKQSIRPVRRNQTPGIAWVPAHDAYYVLAGVLRTATYPLQVAQSALLELEAHLGEDGRPLPFGLLAGGLYSCSESKLLYLLVDSVIPSRADLTPDDPRGQLAAGLKSLAAVADKRGKLVVGWYLGGMEPEPELDPEVDSLHRELFSEQWQLVLVHDASSGTANGAFMRFESIGNKYYPVPFLEVLSKKAARAETDVRHTAVRWASYRTTEPVSLLDVPAVEIPAANGSESAPSEKRLKAWLEPLRRAVYGAPTGHVPVQRPVDEAPATSVALPRRNSVASAQATPIVSPPQRSAQATPITSPPQASAQAIPIASRQQTVRPVPPAVERPLPPEIERPLPLVIEDEVPTERALPIEQPAEVVQATAEVPAPATHQLFINGELITFSEPAADDVEEQLPSHWNRRSIVMPALAALALLVAVGILVLAR